MKWKKAPQKNRQLWQKSRLIRKKKCVAGWSWSLSSYINRIYQCKQNGTSIKCDLLEMCERIKPLHQLFVINV